MAERRDLGSRSGGCLVRSQLWSPAELRLPHAQLRPGHRARCPARALAPCGTRGVLGSARKPQGRTRNYDPGAGALPAQERQRRTRTPSQAV